MFKRNIFFFLLFSLFLFGQGILDRGTYKPNQSSVNVLSPERKKLNQYYKENALPIGEKINFFPFLVREDRKKISLKSLLGKPLVINLAYLNCPVVCGVFIRSLLTSSAESSLALGKDFNLVTVSFLSSETPSLAKKKKALILNEVFSGKKKATYEKYWHIYTGDEENLNNFFSELKFKFVWSEKQKEFFHPTLTYIVDENGKITQILNGLHIDKKTLNFALIESKSGNISNLLEKAFVFCYRYDPESRQYVISAKKLMTMTGIISLIFILIFLFILWRKEIKNKNK